MQTDKPKLTLSQAIALQQASNWQEGEAKRAAERKAEQAAEAQRNQFTERISQAFQAWFFTETGITDMENAQLHVRLDLHKWKSFPVPNFESDMLVWDGVTVGWVFPSVNPEVRFYGEFIERPDGSISVVPGRNGAWLVFWNDMVIKVYGTFEDAVIEALDLPREKDMSDASN